MNFLVTNRVAVPVNIILVPVLLFRAYPSVLGEVICHPTNERFCHSRWWERHVATLRVSGTRMVAVRSDRHHRHPTLRNIWPPKPSYSVNSSRDSNNSNSSGVDPMFINLKLLVTRNSWQLSPLCSTRQKSHWMRMLGFAQLSPSFHYFWHHAQSKTRLDLPRNSFVVRHVFGGITTLACSQLITLPLGMNSRLHSRVTIFQKDSWIGS